MNLCPTCNRPLATECKLCGLPRAQWPTDRREDPTAVYCGTKCRALWNDREYRLKTKQEAK